MSKTAYLVGYLSVRKSPPTLSDIGIFSADARGLTISSMDHFAVDLLSIGGDSFSIAMDSMIDFLAEQISLKKSFLGWSYKCLNTELLKQVDERIAFRKMNEALE